ncbi:hypothetical protein [Veillonella sp. 3310]|uniref:hypothetical protein n=1 Tax=Veillonella sp. 3310 TaxID=2490956 RepID=UPI000FD66859|nr:hypothetical protein [Veillonella sp. 3310]
MELYWFVYFTKDGEHKLIGKYKKECKAFDCVAEYCKDPIKFKDLVFHRDINGFTVGYGVTGEYYSVIKEFV